jgi:acetyl esterase
MPLDPEVEAFLRQLAEMGGKPFHQMTVAEAREAIVALLGDVPRPQVAKVEDGKVPGPGGEIPVRIYWPEGQGPFGVLVYYHGGGWVIGNLETHDSVCRCLTRYANCITISVDYRLAPEHKFPAAPEDCYAAALWASQNASALGGDPSRLAVGGDSAGGNLAAVVAYMAKRRGGPRLVHQLLIYPVTNYAFDTPSYTENAEGYLLTKQDMVWFWGHYLRDEADGESPYASPLRAHDLAGLPAATVITAEYDPLRDEAEEYALRLARAGVPTARLRYQGMIHGFTSLYHVISAGRHSLWTSAASLRMAFAQD